MSGCSRPSTRSRMARARSKRGLAAAESPCAEKQPRQVEEGLCGVGVLPAQHPLPDGQGLTGLRRGLAIAALSIKLLDLLIQPLGLG